MIIDSIQHTKYNTNFMAIKKIKCREVYGQRINCSQYEKLVIEELKKLAQENVFFSKNDVNAQVTVESYWGSSVQLKCKPAAKNIVQKFKNLFISPKIYTVKNENRCPDESAFFVAKKIREVKENKKEFSSVFIENNL